MMKEQAVKIIESYSNHKVIAINPIKNRGLVNQIYILETAAKKYVLRGDLAEDNTDRFQKEMWCSQTAYEQGIFAPEVLTIGLNDGHPYMIMSYIDGTNGDESFEKGKIWNTLGGYARKIHTIHVEGYGEEMSAPGVFRDRWLRYLEYNISSLTSSDKLIELGVITKKQSEHIKKVFLDLQRSDFKFGLTHGDLSLKNTILTAKDEICLLDWGSAKVAPVPHSDIAEILGSSLADDSHEFVLFLAGYGLSSLEYKKLEPEITHLNLLIYIDKLRWAIDRKKERIGHFSQEVKNRLAKV